MWTGIFPEREPEHYIFPAEKYVAAGDEFKPSSFATDPTQPMGNWKEAWEAAKERAKVSCRFHDRHTAYTRMLEAGVLLTVVAWVLGWSPAATARMAKRYGRIGQAAHDEAVKVMDGAIFEAVVHQNGNFINAGPAAGFGMCLPFPEFPPRV